jgi:hypothetical protein
LADLVVKRAGLQAVEAGLAGRVVDAVHDLGAALGDLGQSKEERTRERERERMRGRERRREGEGEGEREREREREQERSCKPEGSGNC